MGENSENSSDTQDGGSGDSNSTRPPDRQLGGRKADVDALAANAGSQSDQRLEKAGGKDGESYETPSAADMSIPSSVNPDASPNQAAQGDSGDSSSSNDE